MNSTYIDSSFYLNILLNETGHEKHRQVLRANSIFSSVLIAIETERTLFKMVRDRLLTPDEFTIYRNQLDQELKFMTLMDLNFSLATSGQFPLIRIPKSLDLIHLRTALAFKASHQLNSFFTLDENLRQAAAEFGFDTDMG